MARKTRKDRDAERAQKSTIYIDVFINTAPPPHQPHQVLLPPSPHAAPAAPQLLLEPLLPPAGSSVSTDTSCPASSNQPERGSSPSGDAGPSTRSTTPTQLDASATGTAPVIQPVKAADATQVAPKADEPPTSNEAATGPAVVGSTPAEDAATAPRWEKVLWKKQPFSDNYVDESFLQELVVNAEVPTRHFRAVALDAAAVVQQLSLVAASVIMPLHLRARRVLAQHMLTLDAVLLVLGYAVCAVLGGHLLGGSLGRGLRQGVLLVGGVYLLSPLLKTLAASVSEDSVWALTAAALLFHLFLHDYNFVNAAAPQLTGTLALAAGAVSAVLVASTMPSELHVFAQVLFSLELYLLAPFVRRYIRAVSDAAHVAIAVLLAVAASALCLPISTALAVTLFLAHVTLGIVCPAGLVRIHKYKAKINGPWDEAVPRLPQQLHMAQG